MLPTVIEPLRADWLNALAAAAIHDQKGEHIKAVDTVRDFHRALCTI